MSKHLFRFGVVSETMTGRESWLKQVLRAEELGYNILLLRDHFVPDFFGAQFAPLVALMAAAAATTKLRVGTMVIDNDYRHPVMLAKEAATLDLLSGGRFELGLGAGWLRKEYEQAGMDYDRAGIRISRLAESIQVLKGLFSAEPFCFKGEHYSIDGISGFPRPHQTRPPILVGAGKPKMLQLAGREADIIGLLTSSVSTGTLVSDPAERRQGAVSQKLEWIRQGAGERFAEIELSLCPTVIITDDRARRVKKYISDNGWSDVSVADVLAMPSVFIGSATEIATDMIARREQYGFSYYVIGDAQMEACGPIVAQLAGR